MFTNDRGDVLQLQDADHEAFAAYRYDAYGRPTATSFQGNDGAMPAEWAEAIAERNVLRYASYVYDAHCGLYYLQRRSYDPLTRQFLSRDPLRSDGNESPYQYCAGDPVAATDPWGLMMVQGSGAGGGGKKQTTTLRHLYAVYDLRVLKAYVAATYAEERTSRRWKASLSQGSETIDGATLAAGGKGAVNFWAGFADNFAGYVGQDIAQPFHGPGLEASYRIGQGDALACELVAGAWGLRASVTSWRAARAAGAVAQGEVRVTAHGAERLAGSGFTDDVVRLTKAEGHVLRQSDGATVFLRESYPGRFDFIVEGERGVITAHRDWPQKAIDRIAKNFEWSQ